MIKNYILSVATLAIFTGCSMANLSYNNERLALQVDKKQLIVNGTPINSHKDNYNNLYLLQETLRLDGGNVVVYEEATTDIDYEFNLAVIHSIKAILDADDIEEIYSQSFFYLFQVLLKDGRTLNVAAEQHDDQRLSLVYGFSTAQLERVIKHLEAKPKQTPVEDVITTKNEAEALHSKWTTTMVHFTPLIIPARYINGR